MHFSVDPQIPVGGRSFGSAATAASSHHGRRPPHFRLRWRQRAAVVLGWPALLAAVVAAPGQKVARWQNWTPSFPLIVPGGRALSAIQGKEGLQFCSVAQRSNRPEAIRAKRIRSKNLATAIWQPCLGRRRWRRRRCRPAC